jgi:putative transposase
LIDKTPAPLASLRKVVELDILLQKRRDKATAKRFSKRVLAPCPEVSRKIITDQLRSYCAAKAAIPELANVKHVFVKASARVNNRAGNSHQLMRERERPMRGFRDPERSAGQASERGQHWAVQFSDYRRLRTRIVRTDV